MLDQLKFRTQTILDNYRHIIQVDNALIHVFNLVCVVAGAFLVVTSGTLGIVFGAILLLGGVLGLADSIYARI